MKWEIINDLFNLPMYIRKWMCKEIVCIPVGLFFLQIWIILMALRFVVPYTLVNHIYCNLKGGDGGRIYYMRR